MACAALSVRASVRRSRRGLGVQARCESLPALLQRASLSAAAAARSHGCHLRGSGVALGLPSRWSLQWDAGGRSFAERVRVAQLDLRGAHDAATGDSWQTDLSGLATRLREGDDAHDRAVLCTLVRTGQWAAAALEGHLECSRESTGVLGLSLPGSPVVGRLWLHDVAGGATPLRLELTLHSGGSESWSWAHWPTRAVHTQATGQTSDFTAASVSDEPETAEAPPQSLEEALAAPSEEEAAPFPFQSAAVEVARSPGAHFLVLATLGGTPAWLVLDPCCDTGALTRAAATSAAWEAVGEQRVHALGGAACAPLRRGGPGLGVLQFGGLRLPLTTPHLELSLDGLGLQAPQGAAVAGLLGGAALRRCVLELHAPRRVPGARDAPRLRALVHPPGGYSPPPRVAVSWQRMRFIDGAPHVRAEVRLEEGTDAPAHAGWYRLALGVGGTALLLSNATAQAMRFSSTVAPLQPGGTMAGPGEGRARMALLQEGELLSGRVASVELVGASFRFARAIVHAVDPQDLQLSQRCAGLLCADLFRGCTLVLDWANERLAVVSE
jgi:hypothetical protein